MFSDNINSSNAIALVFLRKQYAFFAQDENVDISRKSCLFYDFCGAFSLFSCLFFTDLNKIPRISLCAKYESTVMSKMRVSGR
jgi:hypothetical protein